jgi:hypothetical protein
MNKLKIWFGIIVFGLLLTGCVSGPKFPSYRATLSPPPVGMGRIWFYRRSVFFGDALEPSVKLDDVKVGNIVAGSFFQVETPIGVHTVSTTTESTHKTAVTVGTNADSYVQFFIVPGVFVGHIIPTVMSEPDALPELQKLNFEK